MTKEQEDEIIASQWTLWATPKKPTCFFDEVIVNIVKTTELALKQNIVEKNDEFWRKAYEQGTRRQDNFASPRYTRKANGGRKIH